MTKVHMPLLSVEELLAARHSDDLTLRQLIEDLARVYGARAYQSLFKTLFQLDLTAAAAQHHWRATMRAQQKKVRSSMRIASIAAV